MVMEMVGMNVPMCRFFLVIVVAAVGHGGTPCIVVCCTFNTLKPLQGQDLLRGTHEDWRIGKRSEMYD
jgi:hypothetical protein